MNRDITSVIAGKLSLPDVLAARLVCVEWSRVFANPRLEWFLDFNGYAICFRRHNYVVYFSAEKVTTEICEPLVYRTRNYYYGPRFATKPRQNLPQMASMAMKSPCDKAVALMEYMFGDLSTLLVLYLCKSLGPSPTPGTVTGDVIKFGNDTVETTRYLNNSLKNYIFVRCAQNNYICAYHKDTKIFADNGWEIYEHVYHKFGQN